MEGQGLKILIADDEIRMRRILSDYLQIRDTSPFAHRTAHRPGSYFSSGSRIWCCWT